MPTKGDVKGGGKDTAPLRSDYELVREIFEMNVPRTLNIFVSEAAQQTINLLENKAFETRTPIFD
jgi:hypothetical protein